MEKQDSTLTGDESPNAQPVSESVQLADARKAAILLTMIDSESGRRMLQSLAQESRALVAGELERIDNVSAEERLQVVHELKCLTQDSNGGDDSIEWDISAASLLESRSQQSLSAGPESLANEERFKFLKSATLSQLERLLSELSQQACAVILSCLERSHSEAWITSRDADVRISLSRRVSRLGSIAPEVWDRLERHVLLKWRAVRDMNEMPNLDRETEQPALSRRGSDRIPQSSLATREAVSMPVSNRLPPRVPRTAVPVGAADRIDSRVEDRGRLAGIGQNPPERIMEQIVSENSFEVMRQIEPAALRNLLHGQPAELWALALRGASMELRLMLFEVASSAVSARLEAAIRDLGPVQLDDIEEAQQFLLRRVLEHELHEVQR